MRLARTNSAELNPILTLPDNSVSQENKYSIFFPAIALKLKRVALPLFFIFLIGNLSTVSAGPVLYGACVSACLSTLVAPWLTPACIAACTPILIGPGP